MELKRQWCDNKTCPDFGKIEAGNIKVLSHVEQRYYCTTCQHSCSADKHTFFATVRSPRSVVLEALALFNERNSLRAVARLKHLSANRVLHWLALAGQPAAAVSAERIRELHLTQVQIDELWTVVKKNKPTASRRIRLMSVICGSGVPWPCPADCA
jgi:transposase-like protein